MSIDAKVLDKLADLSRLEIRDDDKAAVAEKLNGVIGFVEQLSEVDTTGVTPMASPTAAANGTLERVDEVSVENQRDDFMKVAPEGDMGFYVVPRVVE